jgi:hypothetical protein
MTWLVWIGHTLRLEWIECSECGDLVQNDDEGRFPCERCGVVL